MGLGEKRASIRAPISRLPCSRGSWDSLRNLSARLCPQRPELLSANESGLLDADLSTHAVCERLKLLLCDCDEDTIHARTLMVFGLDPICRVTGRV